MGLAFGIASVIWLGFIFNDTVIEISLTLAVSYIAFFTVSIDTSIISCVEFSLQTFLETKLLVKCIAFNQSRLKSCS